MLLPHAASWALTHPDIEPPKRNTLDPFHDSKFVGMWFPHWEAKFHRKKQHSWRLKKATLRYKSYGKRNVSSKLAAGTRQQFQEDHLELEPYCRRTHSQAKHSSIWHLQFLNYRIIKHDKRPYPTCRKYAITLEKAIICNCWWHTPHHAPPKRNMERLSMTFLHRLLHLTLVLWVWVPSNTGFRQFQLPGTTWTLTWTTYYVEQCHTSKFRLYHLFLVKFGGGLLLMLYQQYQPWPVLPRRPGLISSGHWTSGDSGKSPQHTARSEVSHGAE